jgi:hypothetical protein
MSQSLDWMAAADHCGFFSSDLFQAAQQPSTSSAARMANSARKFVANAFIETSSKQKF